MEKLEPVNHCNFLYQWDEHVRTLFFPPPVFEVMKPDMILIRWSKESGDTKDRLRYKTDALVRRVIYAPSAEAVVTLLLSTAPELVAAFYDRIVIAHNRLAEEVRRGQTYFEDPYATWRDLARILLLGEPLQ